MEKITTGVIGAGRIGKLHTDNLLQHFPYIHIKTIADPNIDEAWAANRSIPFTRDYREIIQDPAIEAVLICSPSSLHSAHIIEAAKARKHIFCEKPVATDLTQIENALREVQKANIKFQVGFNRRFDPNFAKVKSVISNDGIGMPHLLRITSRDPKIPPNDFIKTSGGMFLDMTIHDFDMARFLIESKIKEVYAAGSVLIDPVFSLHSDIDTAIIHLKFENGTLGVIDNSRQAVYGYDQRIEVFGSKGSVYADNNKPTNTVISTKEGVSSDKPLYYFLERYKDSFIAELQQFFNSVMHDQPCVVSGKDGLLSMVIALAAQQSLEENRPIKIDYEQWAAL